MNLEAEKETADDEALQAVVDAVAEGETPAEGQEDATADESADEIVVTIGDDDPKPEPVAQAPEWVRDMRRQNREMAKRIKELEAAQAPAKALDSGPEPTLEACDYDEKRLTAETLAWARRKLQAEQAEAKATAEAEAADRAWQERLQGYEKGKAALPVADFSEAEAEVQDALSVTQQGIILNGADNPALLIYALGKAPAKAQELGKISDPVRFAFAVAKLEAQVKMGKRTSAPPPEKRLGVSATAGGVKGADATLDKLREEALRTGDTAKLMAYKRQLRAAAT
ncbi:hypothetical protein [Thiocapsa sp. N5-Cardenillas]|uniref:hypothetical protein n=1 Tax=Thiocapsa sp. N5-Cardenillas TaxID=3137397 RepID=UPI0035B39F87